MSGWVDEKQTTVDSGVQNVAVTNSGELLAEVCAVLVLDVFDNRIPASRERSGSVGILRVNCGERTRTSSRC